MRKVILSFSFEKRKVSKGDSPKAQTENSLLPTPYSLLTPFLKYTSTILSSEVNAG